MLRNRWYIFTRNDWYTLLRNQWYTFTGILNSKRYGGNHKVIRLPVLINISVYFLLNKPVKNEAQGIINRIEQHVDNTLSGFDFNHKQRF